MPGRVTPLGLLHLFSVLSSVFFFSGVLFGWSPLQSLLLSERSGQGQFSELCKSHSRSFQSGGSNDTGKITYCEEQLAELTLIYTLSTFALSFVSLPGGWFVDTYGVRATVCLSCVLNVAGLSLFSVSDSIEFNLFIPAACLMSVGGFLCMCGSWPAAFLYSHWQTIILASISCLFDASSIIPAIFEALSHIGRRRLFLSYAAWGLILHILMFSMWSCVSNERPNEEYSEIKEQDSRRYSQERMNEDKSNQTGTRHRLPPVPLQERSLSQQLRSFQFVFAVVFASCQQLRANAYIGMNNNLLHRYGDNGFYTETFGWFLPAGVVFIPIIDYAVTRLGISGALHATNALGIIYGTLVLFDKPLELQFGTFFFFAAFRAFLYSVMSSYNAQVFGLRTLGRITGCIFTSSAVFQLLQYPLNDMVEITFEGDPFWPCLGLVGLVVPIFGLLLILQKRGDISSPAENTITQSPLNADAVVSGNMAAGTPNFNSPLLINQVNKDRKGVSPMKDLDLNSPLSQSTPESFGSPTSHLRTPSTTSKLKV